MRKNFVGCKNTADGVFIPCPNCGHGRLMRITPETSGKNIVLWCKRCKTENIFDIEAGTSVERVSLRTVYPPLQKKRVPCNLR